MNGTQPSRHWALLAGIGPGLLVAATGVGAGDLMTASYAGSDAGITLLWAAWMGAVLKWFMNEGIARWQMATDSTLLEGWVDRLGRWIRWVFMIYLLVWSFVVGGALVNACGVAGTAFYQLSDSPQVSKQIYGVLHSLAGLLLVLKGGFRLFERLMAIGIAVMVCTVTGTVLWVQPEWGAVCRGALLPSIPDASSNIKWVLGILGGVGGTVTLLSYGYWIREKGRAGTAGLRTCRWDLGVGYAMTALFGMAMVIVGSRVALTSGPMAAVQLADELARGIGATGKWIFLVGFWSAVFSSLLGVWQSVPYMFADFLHLHDPQRERQAIAVDLARTGAYRAYLVALALVPLALLWTSVKQVQIAYAVLGSFFMPLLALTLLIMNSRRDWVGPKFANGLLFNTALAVTILFFAGLAAAKIYQTATALL